MHQSPRADAKAMLEGKPLGPMIRAMDAELDSIARWWLDHAVDLDKGEIAGEVSNDNQPNPSTGLGLVYVARLLWFFSAAYRHRAREGYKAAAMLCREILADRFTDDENGGLVWSLDAGRRPESSKKQSYGQAFAIYGLSEYFLAFGDEDALQAASGLVDLLEQHVHDREHGGYLEALDAGWKPLADVRLGASDANADKTMNTHLHILEAYTNYHRAKQSAESSALLAGLLELFLDRFALPGGDHLVCFYTRHWEEVPAAISFGHDIEASWLICEAADVLGDARLSGRSRSCAIALAHGVLDRGIDKLGGILHERGPGERVDTSHVWWVQAEAMVGFFSAWQLTGAKSFLETSLDCWKFIRDHQRDKEHGEWRWFSKLDCASNGPYKAGPWKGPYHNGRALLEMLHRLADTQESSA